jgi:putative (di)nucleoside polyphosphate hydrolase
MTVDRDRASGPSDYRPCAAIVLFDGQGRVLVAERNDVDEPAWQIPQGGIRDGESPVEAALRELAEETGATAEPLAEASDWITYDWPDDLGRRPFGGRYRGQKVMLVALSFTGRDEMIDLDATNAEFRAWRWAELEDLPAMIVGFKKELYEVAVREFISLRDALRRGLDV